MLNQELIGKWSTPVPNMVEPTAVHKFVEAIGDLNPIYQKIAPPTFPITFDYGHIEGLDIPHAGLIHGEQNFHYERPLMIGETLLCSYRIADTYSRKGSLGKMTFLLYEQQGVTDAGELVFSMKSTVIMTEKGGE